MMTIKMIATDMDGTFLDDEKKVPPQNREALRRCADLGIEIVPATGRTVTGIPDALKELPGVRYAITTNGAVVVDLKENREISACRIPVETAVQVLRLARESGDDIMYDAYIDGAGISMNCFLDHLMKYVKTEGLAELVRKTRRVVPDTILYVEEQGKPVDKINMFFTDMEARERMRAALGTVDGIMVTSAISNNLEINAAGADKGGALLRLAAYLHIDREEVMAFGDGENDLSMIRSAGMGIAMANGIEEARAAADYVTGTNNQGGVAEAIGKFVLSAASDGKEGGL